MNRNLKVCLIVGGGLVFLLGLVVIGSATLLYLNWDKVRQGVADWKENMMGYAVEGSEYGAHTDQDGCLDEGLRRPEGTGAFGLLPASVFLAECLESATKTEGFCDNVPPAGEIMATVAWIQKRCAEEGRAGDQGCLQLMPRVQVHCLRHASR